MTEYRQIEHAWQIITSGKAGKCCKDDSAYVGVDIGTANIVSIAVNRAGAVLAGRITPSQVVKEGLIVDYIKAVKVVNEQVAYIKRALNCPIQCSASAYPPKTEQGNRKVTANVLEAAGLEVKYMIDEPTAAAVALDIDEGIIVDVGGGSTGISVIRNGEVVYVADEPTGGFQMDLVLAGHYGIPVSEAEKRKLEPEKQNEIYHIIRPVFEKVIAITDRHTRQFPVDTIYMVGGASSFPGFEDLMGRETGKTVVLPRRSLLVTPYGIARSCIQHIKISQNVEE